MGKLTYSFSGVDYPALDAFKRACRLAARSTRTRGLTDSHGVELNDTILIHVEEGLGTKSLVADEMFHLTGKCHYHSLGVDLVAAIVNDVVTMGAMPLTAAMHIAAGSSAWFGDERRAGELIAGFSEGCRRAGAAWVGGETSVLTDIIAEKAVALSGSAVGVLSGKSNQIRSSIKEHDAIVLIASTGVHANGLTLCRAAAAKLPEGFLTHLDDGRTFGQALLTPSAMYVDLVRQCQVEKIELHSAIHITGHGWRKLMRANEPFLYRIDAVRDYPSEIKLLIDHDLIDLKEAFATFNMGAGFALIVGEADVGRVIRAAQQCNHHAWRAGTVIKSDSEKSVEIAPLGIRYEAQSLRL